MKSINLPLNFRHHPKIKLLRAKLGCEGVLSFVFLLMSVAENYPTSGRLPAANEVEAALAADWQGEPLVFVETLEELRLLERKKRGGWIIHDWSVHQKSFRHGAAAFPNSSPARLFLAQEEKAANAGKPFISLPLIPRDGEYKVTQVQAAEWGQAYPGLGIEGVKQQLRNMREWLKANPQRRKTRTGINRFIINWLNRTQDRGSIKAAGDKASASLWDVLPSTGEASK